MQSHCIVFYRDKDMGRLKNLIATSGAGSRRRRRLSDPKFQADLDRLEQIREYCEQKVRYYLFLPWSIGDLWTHGISYVSGPQRTCRRVFLGRHFGEHFEPGKCLRTCDICSGRIHTYPQPDDRAPAYKSTGERSTFGKRRKKRRPAKKRAKRKTG